MFFYIGHNCPLNSLEQKSNNIFLDKGWNVYKGKLDTYWYKGYSTECSLEHSIDHIADGYKPNGKWAVISSKQELFYPVLRGFPLYRKNNIITNIPLDDFEEQAYDTITISRPDVHITLQEASKKINDILRENIINFFRYNNLDILNVLFSAGIDTLTVWAIIENLGYSYNLHIHHPKNNDIFGVRQEYDSDLIDLVRKKFWGYKMTSCFSNKNYYITGFYSERIQIREVTQGHTIANYKNKILHELPNKEDYLYLFLQRPSNKINDQPTFTTEADVLAWCNKSIFYDHQMWHIDNNFHFSPFNDIRITEVMNQLSLDDIVHNAFTAIIQKNIIEMNKLEFLSLLPKYKNEGDIWENYRNNFENIRLNHCKHKYIT
jgi:hypothetical protein